MPQTRRSLEEMLPVLDEFKRSQLSLFAFARTRQLPYATLRYWSRRADAATNRRSTQVRFVQARPLDVALPPALLEITVDARITIRAATHTDPEILRGLVHALLAPC